MISHEKSGGAGPRTSAWLSRLAAGLWEDRPRDGHILGNGTHTQEMGHSLEGEGLPSVPSPSLWAASPSCLIGYKCFMRLRKTSSDGNRVRPRPWLCGGWRLPPLGGQGGVKLERNTHGRCLLLVVCMYNLFSQCSQPTFFSR